MLCPRGGARPTTELATQSLPDYGVRYSRLPWWRSSWSSLWWWRWLLWSSSSSRLPSASRRHHLRWFWGWGFFSSQRHWQFWWQFSRRIWGWLWCFWWNCYASPPSSPLLPPPCTPLRLIWCWCITTTISYSYLHSSFTHGYPAARRGE